MIEVGDPINLKEVVNCFFKLVNQTPGLKITQKGRLMVKATDNPDQYSFIFVYPDDKNWDKYLEMCFEYLNESWPKVFSDKRIMKDYEKQLKDRFFQKNRCFLFLKKRNKTIGLANLYFHEDSLFVAEYYIVPDERRQKTGYKSFLNIIRWAKNKAKNIKIEVDKDLENANNFWLSFNCTLDNLGKRNIYIIMLS